MYSQNFKAIQLVDVNFESAKWTTSLVRKDKKEEIQSKVSNNRVLQPPCRQSLSNTCSLANENCMRFSFQAAGVSSTRFRIVAVNKCGAREEERRSPASRKMLLTIMKRSEELKIPWWKKNADLYLLLSKKVKCEG